METYFVTLVLILVSLVSYPNDATHVFAGAPSYRLLNMMCQPQPKDRVFHKHTVFRDFNKFSIE